MTPAARDPELVAGLRAAGCVFAEDEAAVLQEWAPDAVALAAAARRRRAGEPLEHIVGFVEFGGLRLAVGPGAFVPRRRSLLLAHTVIGLLDDGRPPLFAEACCGVAPIAATVRAHRAGVSLHACDADPVALGYARRNLPPEAQIGCGTLLSGLAAEVSGFGVIAAVPPYVPEPELPLLPPEALEHEPLRALAGGPDGLAVAGELLNAARERLAPDGVLALELYRGQVPAAGRLASALGYWVRVVEGDDGQTVVLVAGAELSP